jgi:hypothetical protein
MITLTILEEIHRAQLILEIQDYYYFDFAEFAVGRL